MHLAHRNFMASSSSLPPSSTLLLLSLPPKTFVGIDLLSFDSSPNFHGIGEIPLGLHFLFSGTDASLAIRHGRWLKILPETPTALVFKWNGKEEALDLLDSRSSDALAASSAIPALRKRGLIDYNALEDASLDAQAKQDAESSAKAGGWVHLTDHITTSTLDRVLTADWTLTSIASAPSDTEHIPGLTNLEAFSALPANSALNLVPIELKQTWPEDAIGRERTDKARDRSWYLGHLMDVLAPGDRQTGAKELLGELQFCFLMVLTLANYSCLEQWKRILTVVFTCQKALTEIKGYFVEVLKVVKLQMEHVDDVDGGLFDLTDETNSAWLRHLGRKLRLNVEEATKEDSEVRRAIEELEEFMRERYGWESGRDILKRGMLELEDGEKIEVTMDGADEDEETGEYAPLVVKT